MAKTVEEELAQIQADEKRLKDRKERLRQKDRKNRIDAVEKSGLLELPFKELEAHLKAIKDMGMEEFAKRMGSAS